jgi:hypothetical protein
LGLLVRVGEDLGGYLDQVGVQPAGVPGPERFRGLGGGQADGVPEQVVGLGDELHVGVLDAVVDHLDEVAGAVGADVRAARGSVDVGADRLEHGAQGLVGLRRSARHDRRAEQRALLAAGDSHADEVQVALFEGGFAAAGVVEVGVAAVDEHVPRLEQRGELVDYRVGGLARVDHDKQASWPFEGSYEVLGGLRGDEGSLMAELVHGVGDAGGRPVVQGDGETVASEVAGQVAAHHAQSGDANLRLRLRVFRHLLLVSSGRRFLVSLCHPGPLRCRGGRLRAVRPAGAAGGRDVPVSAGGSRGCR